MRNNKHFSKTHRMDTPSVRVNARAVRFMRTVGEEEAFFFYETLGKPTGASAKSIYDFLDKAKTISLESLVFHLQRGDFQNWIAKILGDSELAENLGKISCLNNPSLRVDVCRVLENRLKEVKTEQSLVISIGDDASVIPARALREKI
jgi:hypothetical protein